MLYDECVRQQDMIHNNNNYHKIMNNIMIDSLANRQFVTVLDMQLIFTSYVNSLQTN